MKQFLPSLISWWFATMTSISTPVTTLAERENMRKRRMLSVLMSIDILLFLTAIGLSFFLNITVSVPVNVLTICAFSFALWLNKQGYLRVAGLLYFFSGGISVLLNAQALTDSQAMLWTFFFITVLPSVAGLFLTPLMIILMGMLQMVVMIWYLLVLRHDFFIHVLSTSQVKPFLTSFCFMVSLSTIIGVFYAITTKKAILQADRTTELEQTHHELTSTHADLEEAYTMIQRQALTDGLTGLPNHRAVIDLLQKEVERARRYDRPFSVLFFDADRFKQVNDTYGHAVGDAVLRQIGELVGSALRGGDILGRFGGEEFVVLLPEADAREASTVAERIRVAVATGPLVMSEVEGGIAMTVSIGVATYQADGITEQALLSQADEAMYVAKRLGRNQVRTAEEARHMSADVELMALLLQEGKGEAATREGTRPEQLRETYTSRMICSLMALLERRDEGLSVHARAVSELATTIAQAMDIEAQAVSRIGMAALLHDIGKVAIPDRFLQKADYLSARERTLLEEHAELGAQIMDASPFLHDLQPAVRHHHERWDGYGYPDQLRGEDIPLAARIIAVAEAYDAMLRDHPYQAHQNVEEAMKEVQHCAGTQFDPAVVQVLSGLLVQQQPTRYAVR